MDKKNLHNLLNTILTDAQGVPTTSTTISITFLQEHKGLTGEYKILQSKSGRGKGGSRVLKLLNTTTGAVLESIVVDGKARGIGTPTSNYILNITMNGEKHGNTSEKDVPQSYPRDEVKARHLRNVVKQLVGTEGKKIRINSTEPEFCGEWDVVSSRMSPGRFGQVVLLLQSGERSVEFWSYRHSGITTLLEIL